jgi:DNA-directed RNA polymerase subunit RPC12/RpoP
LLSLQDLLITPQRFEGRTHRERKNRITNRMCPEKIPLIVDLNVRCPTCEFEIPPDHPVFVEALRCPECGHEWPKKKTPDHQG